jgi:hypothetical protein
VIDAILEEDKQRPSKQRHSAKRIFERLREEHGFTGGYTIVKDYVRSAELRSREMFIPLTHAPGEAQVGFGEALVVIAGVEQKTHYLAMDLPHSDDWSKPASVSSRPSAYFQSMRARTASEAWRSESPSVNCSTVARANRPGASAGWPRRGNSASNCLSWYTHPNTSPMRRHAQPFGNAAKPTRRVSSGTPKSSCGLSDMAESSTPLLAIAP